MSITKTMFFYSKQMRVISTGNFIQKEHENNLNETLAMQLQIMEFIKIYIEIIIATTNENNVIKICQHVYKNFFPNTIRSDGNKYYFIARSNNLKA